MNGFMINFHQIKTIQFSATELINGSNGPFAHRTLIITNSGGEKMSLALFAAHVEDLAVLEEDPIDVS